MFSVIIPLYNKAKYVQYAVESVLAQTFKTFELIIVNDGSTDDGVELIKNNFSDPRIILVNQHNQGVAAARNKGIDYARYDYVAFLDADDFWSPSFLEENVKVIQDFPNVEIIGSDYNVVHTHSIDNSNKTIAEPPFVIKNYFKEAYRNALFHSSSAIVKTEVLKSLGGFNTKMTHGEDIDMWIRIMMHTKVAVLNPQKLTYYYVGDPHQATANLPVLQRHLVGNMLDLYTDYINESNKKYLKKFIDKYILLNLRPYYMNDDSLPQAKNILSRINTWSFPLGLFYLIPRPIAKLLYKIVKN